jgi:hypothetical protein
MAFSKDDYRLMKILHSPISLGIDRFNGKSKDNFCSMPFLAFNANPPMIIFNDLLALEQANPQPGLL